MRRAVALLAAALMLSMSEARGAEEAGETSYAIDSVVSAGYRMVDIDGSKDKYREDYNLRSGGRLFTLDVAGTAKAPDTAPLDRFHLEVDTPGDEPVSRFRLTAADRPRYDFRADFVRSKYFYSVPQLFEEAVAGDVRLDDLHDFNLVRTNGTVDLTLLAKGLPTLFLGYRLYERHGDALSTVRIPAGDTFLVEAPVDTATHVGRLGSQFGLLGADVFLQQEYRRVDRRRDLEDVRTPAGLDPMDASTLDFFGSRQDERLDIPISTVRVRRAVGEAVELTGAYLYSHADLDFELSRQRRGTTNVPGLPGSATSTGRGDAALHTHVADAGASVRLAEPVQVHLDYRFDERSHDGALDERSSFGRIAALTGDHVRTHRATSEIELVPRADLSLRVGVRYARRDARFSQTLQEIATDALGAVASVRYRPWSVLDLFARYENAQIADPFVAAGDEGRIPPLPEREIALTFTNRASAGAQLRPHERVTLRYEFVADSRENATFAARSRVFANSGAVSVTPIADLTMFAGYTRRDLDNEADILLAPLYGRSLSLQDGTEGIVVSELRYDFALRGLAWSAGWDVAWFRIDTALRPRLEPGLAGRKFFDLDRVDAGAFLALRHRWLEPAVEFRMIEYEERVLPRNDYRATMVVLKLTKRWSL